MSDALRLTISVVLFVPCASLCIACWFVQIAIIDEINRKLPNNTQISYLGGHIGKAFRVRDEYKRLYPEGRLQRRFDVLFAFATIFAACSAAVLFRVVR